MKLVKTVAEVKEQVKAWRKEGFSIGLVPTMGYLHEGHKSLIDRAVKENDRVVVSDFVNPIQFGPTEDLESYPRDIEADCALCEAAGAALVFHPDASEMYGENFTTHVDTTGVTQELCGKSRPIHFGRLFCCACPFRMRCLSRCGRTGIGFINRPPLKVFIKCKEQEQSCGRRCLSGNSKR